MAKDERIVQVIFDAVDEVNEYLPKHQKIDKTMDTILIDELSQVDSLALVNLMATIEQKVEDEYAVAINLTDGDLLSQINNPFKSIATLADHIFLLIGGEKQ
jgi:acyl carrier protein